MTPTPYSYYRVFSRTLLFFAAPLLLELLVYLCRKETMPEASAAFSVLLVLFFAFLLFAAVAGMLALILRLLRLQPEVLFPSAFLGLFLALISARLLPLDTGATPARLLVFTLSLAAAVAGYIFLSRKQLPVFRVAVAQWIFCVSGAYALSHLFEFPFRGAAGIFVLFPLLFAVLFVIPLRILAAGAAVILFLHFQQPTVIPAFAPPSKLDQYKRVILVGIDGLSPEVVRRMAAEGKLPAFAHMMKNGVSGNLHTLGVPFSPLVWNTIYTGAGPRTHGIMAFTRTGVAGGSPFLSLWLDNWTNSDWIHRSVEALQKLRALRIVSPATAKNRAAPAIWNLIDQNGFDSIVVGGWTTYPPEIIRGPYVSDYAAVASKPLGTYYPPGKRIDDLLAFQPEVSNAPAEIKHYMEKDEKLHKLTLDLIQNATANTRFVFSYYSQVDAYGHHYGTYLDLKSTTAARRAELLHMREQVYTNADRYVQDYLKMLDDNTLLIVCSDHGFHFDKRQHNYPVDGIILMMGRGVRKNTSIEDSVYALAPTVTYALGLEPSSQFQGLPIKQAFEGIIHELKPRKYNLANRFFEVQGQNELDEQKLRELEDLQYINR